MAKTVLLAAPGAESRTAVRSSRRAVLVVLVALGLSTVVAVGLLALRANCKRAAHSTRAGSSATACRQREQCTTWLPRLRWDFLPSVPGVSLLIAKRGTAS